MKSAKTLLWVICGCVLLAPLSVQSHHSGAMFEDQVVLTLRGTVTRFDYLNPHSWLYVNVESDDGALEEWGFELDAPTRLRRIGVSPTFWKPGDKVTVKTRPLRDGRPAGFLVGSITDNGQTFGDVSGLRP